MSWTKRQVVLAAYNGIGFSDDEFEITAEELESALKILDAMMALWNAKGINLGYNAPSSPDNSDLDDDSGLPDHATEAAWTNLSVRLAPTFGKAASPVITMLANDSYKVLFIQSVQPRDRAQNGTQLTGAGNKNTSRIFTTPDPESITNRSGASDLDLDVG